MLASSRTSWTSLREYSSPMAVFCVSLTVVLGDDVACKLAFDKLLFDNCAGLFLELLLTPLLERLLVLLMSVSITGYRFANLEDREVREGSDRMVLSTNMPCLTDESTAGILEMFSVSDVSERLEDGDSFCR